MATSKQYSNMNDKTTVIKYLGELHFVDSGGSTLATGAQAPQILPAPQIFGHSSSATGWINWFYSKFRLAVVATQMMRAQAPKYFFLEPPLFVEQINTQ